MKGTNKSQQIFLYIVLLGILAIALVYFFVYTKYNDETAALKNRNDTLQKRVESLKQYYDDYENYCVGMDHMNSDIDNWLNEFPSEVREEDVVKLALNCLDEAEIFYQTVTTPEKEEIAAIDPTLIAAGTYEGCGENLSFDVVKGSYTLQLDYENLKNMVKVINQKSERSSLRDITLVYDKDLCCLAGTTDVDFYSVQGTGKEYVQPDFEDYLAGLRQLFAGRFERATQEEE